MSGVTLDSQVNLVNRCRKREHAINRASTVIAGATVAGAAYAAPKLVSKLGLGKTIAKGVSFVQRGLGKIGKAFGNFSLKPSPTVFPGKFGFLKKIAVSGVNKLKNVSKAMHNVLMRYSWMTPKTFAKGVGTIGLALLGAKLLYNHVKNSGRIDQKYDMVSSAVK